MRGKSVEKKYEEKVWKKVWKKWKISTKEKNRNERAESEGEKGNGGR